MANQPPTKTTLEQFLEQILDDDLPELPVLGAGQVKVLPVAAKGIVKPNPIKSITCPKCGAEPGEDCIGLDWMVVHEARADAYHGDQPSTKAYGPHCPLCGCDLQIDGSCPEGCTFCHSCGAFADEDHNPDCPTLNPEVETEPTKGANTMNDDKGPPLPPDLETLAAGIAGTHVADVEVGASCPTCKVMANQPCKGLAAGYVHKARWQAYANAVKALNKGQAEAGADKPPYLIVCPTCSSLPGIKCRDHGKIVKPHVARLVASGLVKPTILKALICEGCKGQNLSVDRVVRYRHLVLGTDLGGYVVASSGPDIHNETSLSTLVTCVDCGWGKVYEYPTGHITFLASKDQQAAYLVSKPLKVEDL